MDNLSEEQKHYFENSLRNITDKDEQKVLAHIQPEISKLKTMLLNNPSHKMENLIVNAELLLEILLDKQFPLTISSKKWVIFGLSYLISDFDLIPDVIPVIGYNDDALILQWVIFMIDKDISRYKIFKNTKTLVGKNNLLIPKIIDTETKYFVVVLPGLIEKSRKELESILDKSLVKYFGKNDNIRYELIQKDIHYLQEFSKTIRIVDHEMGLKPTVDQEQFGIEWQQIKEEYQFIGESLGLELNNLVSQNPHIKIVILSFNVGSIAVEKALTKMTKGSIENYFSFGGASIIEELPSKEFCKIEKVINFYSENDYLLKYIFEQFEKNRPPIGLKPFLTNDSSNIENINATTIITNHGSYVPNISKLINLKY
ncbi:MAG: DUF726 domain-containing protein [Bacteroidales bacterium]|nr:DUF726 domain-containing protein [Bacteroidales bacterium]